MRFIFNSIKNLLALAAIIFVVFLALKYAPFLKDQSWNPVSSAPSVSEQNKTQHELKGGQKYTIEDNDLLKNIPLSQSKKVFNWINKQEFMSVSGLDRMGYNDDYLVGQRDGRFIVYKFGDDSMRVYATEIEMQQDLNQLGQHVELKPASYYDK